MNLFGYPQLPFERVKSGTLVLVGRDFSGLTPLSECCSEVSALGGSSKGAVGIMRLFGDPLKLVCDFWAVPRAKGWRCPALLTALSPSSLHLLRLSMSLQSIPWSGASGGESGSSVGWGEERAVELEHLPPFPPSFPSRPTAQGMAFRLNPWISMAGLG